MLLNKSDRISTRKGVKRAKYFQVNLKEIYKIMTKVLVVFRNLLRYSTSTIMRLLDWLLVFLLLALVILFIVLKSNQLPLAPYLSRIK